MSTKMIRISALISAELDEKLEKLSEELHSSKSDVFLKAIFLLDIAARSKKENNRMAVVNTDNQIVSEILGL